MRTLHNLKTRKLSIESLENRELLSVNPFGLNNDYKIQAIESSPISVMSASTPPTVSLTSGVLRIDGTSGDDWVEIETTSSQIIVHYGDSLTAIGTYIQSQVTSIVFYGNDGNDTFKNRYGNIFGSISCQLYGGNGNDYLLGSNGNDIIDGGNGNNMIIGGGGTNVFYNTGTGSNLFVQMNSTDTFASGSICGNDDAVLFFSDKDREGRSNHTFNDIPYQTRSWTDQEIFSVLDSISLGYSAIGTYKYFRDPYSADGVTYFTIFDYNNSIWMAGMNSYYPNGNNVSIVFNGSANANTVLHEIGHNWDGGRGMGQNPFWDQFQSISWNTAYSLKTDAVLADFPSSYAYGSNGIGGSAYEDWADTLANVLIGYTPSNASAKYFQKVAIAESFFDWLNQNVGSPTIVTTTADVINANDGVTSLREAIQNVQAGDTITFADSLNGQTIRIDASGDFEYGGIVINRNITIDATGQNISITPDLSYTNDDYYYDKYAIDNWAHVTIKGLTFTGMDADACFSDLIYNHSSGNLSLINCQIVGNSGFVYLSNEGTATLTNCLVAGNTSSFTNRVADGSTYGSWGIDNRGGQLTINNSTVLSDIATYAGNKIILNNSIAELDFDYDSFTFWDDKEGHEDDINKLTIEIYCSYVKIGSNILNDSRLTYDDNSIVSSNFYSPNITTLFVNYSDWYDHNWTVNLWKSWDFRLAANSPALNAGSNTLIPSGITTDILGNARVSNGTVDMGAFERELPPVTPTDFRSTTQTPDSITLNWASQGSQTTYILQYKKSSNNEWTSLNVSNNFVKVTGLETETNYDFKICATNASGTSAPATVTVTTKPAPPVVPPNFTSTATTSDSVTLTWGSQSNLTGYTLQYKKSSDSTWTTVTAPGVSASTATITGLNASTLYDFRLTAINAGGSTSATIINKVTAPVVPPNFASSSKSHNSVTLTWNGQSNLTGYTLQYKKSSDSTWTIVTAPGVSASTATITGLDILTEYDFQLTATNASGTSGYATINSLETLELPPLPTPQNLRAVTAGQTTVALDWNDVAGATSYTVQRKTSSDAEFTTFDPVTSSKFTDSGLMAETEYEYRVQAIGSGVSPYATLTVTTAATINSNNDPIVDTPIFTEPVFDSTENSVTLKWTDLGAGYTYILLKAGNTIADFDASRSEYVDAHPAAGGFEAYVLMAYHAQSYSSVLITVVYTTAKPLEITGHEVIETPQGTQFTLLWKAETGVNYYIYRNGELIPGTLLFSDTIGSWTDENPDEGENEYILSALYRDPVELYDRATFSNFYKLNKPTQTQSQSAAALDAFWADYDFNLVDDDVLNAIA